jgi:hypothetical protein
MVLFRQYMAYTLGFVEVRQAAGGRRSELEIEGYQA